MTDSTKLTSADAVRLARFAYPSIKKWEEDVGPRGPFVWHREGTEIFSLSYLDDLALAEQRVVAAGLGNEYACHLRNIVAADHGPTWNLLPLYALPTASAAQRARALLALLDAHPELEQAK